MQSVHTTKYAVRTLRGNYVKTKDDEGIGYAMFNTRVQAREWAKEQGSDCFVVKVRIAITPTDSGRIERLVAVHETRPKAVSAKHKVEHNFFP